MTEQARAHHLELARSTLQRLAQKVGLHLRLSLADELATHVQRAQVATAARRAEATGAGAAAGGRHGGLDDFDSGLSHPSVDPAAAASPAVSAAMALARAAVEARKRAKAAAAAAAKATVGSEAALRSDLMARSPLAAGKSSDPKWLLQHKFSTESVFTEEQRKRRAMRLLAHPDNIRPSSELPPQAARLAMNRLMRTMVAHHDALQLYEDVWGSIHLNLLAAEDTYFADKSSLSMHVPFNYDEGKLVQFVQAHVPDFAVHVLAQARQSREQAGKAAAASGGAGGGGTRKGNLPRGAGGKGKAASRPPRADRAAWEREKMG